MQLCADLYSLFSQQLHIHHSSIDRISNKKGSIGWDVVTSLRYSLIGIISFIVMIIVCVVHHLITVVIVLVRCVYVLQLFNVQPLL